MMTAFLHRLLVAAAPDREREDAPYLLALADGAQVPVVRARHPRARRMKLTVSDRGVRLTLPPRASLRAGDAFVHAQREWIARQWADHAAGGCAGPFDGGPPQLPLRGAVLALRRETGRYAQARLDGDAVVLTLPASAGKASAQRCLREFYLAQARADVGRWLVQHLPSLPRAPRLIRIRPLSSLWGSLSARDALSLDLALVLAAPASFEYVLVHELCHLLHRHHRPSFWREVEARGQDWRAQRRYLHAHGAALKASLRRVIGR